MQANGYKTEATVSPDVQGPEGSEEVAANKAAFECRVEEIRSHPDYSDEAKKRYLAEAYEDAMERHNQLMAEGTDRGGEDLQATQVGEDFLETCDGHAFGGHRDQGAGEGAALG